LNIAKFEKESTAGQLPPEVHDSDSIKKLQDISKMPFSAKKITIQPQPLSTRNELLAIISFYIKDK